MIKLNGGTQLIAWQRSSTMIKYSWSYLSNTSAGRSGCLTARKSSITLMSYFKTAKSCLIWEKRLRTLMPKSILMRSCRLKSRKINWLRKKKGLKIPNLLRMITLNISLKHSQVLLKKGLLFRCLINRTLWTICWIKQMFVIHLKIQMRLLVQCHVTKKGLLPLEGKT